MQVLGCCRLALKMLLQQQQRQMQQRRQVLLHETPCLQRQMSSQDLQQVQLQQNSKVSSRGAVVTADVKWEGPHGGMWVAGFSSR